jgi:heat-inducible transcriptional repressor
MLTVQKLELEDIQQLEQQFVSAVSPSDLVKNTSNILSGITSMAGVVMLPKREQLLLKQIEFLPLSEKRVLVVLVVNSCEVQNRIIQADCEFSASELQQASNFINHHYVGKDLREIRQATLKEMRNSREHMNELMIKAVEMADMALDGTQQEDGCVVAGQTNLMHYAEMADMGKLRQLFEAFNQQQSILYLLDQSINAEGVQIFIGEESGYEVFDSCSVVTSPYKSGDEVVGVLGVIGPTRMAYDRMIPIVDVTAKLLGAALNSQD